MNRINNSTTPLLISYFLSTTWTAYFSVANRLIGVCQEVLYSITATFLPVFSELGASDNSSAIKEIYKNYTRYVLIMFLPLFALLFIQGPAFLKIWVGPQYAENAGITLRILAVAAAVSGIQPLFTRMVIGSGRLGFYIKVMSISHGLCVVTNFFLIPLIGIKGAAISLLCMNSVNQTLYFLYLRREFDLRLRSLLTRCYLRIIPALSIFAATSAIFLLAYEAHSYLTFFYQTCVTFVFYGTAVLLFSLKSEERAYLYKNIRYRDFLSAKRA